MPNKKILVVDDEEIARITLTDILQLQGFEVEAVENGEEAILRLNSSSFDLAILDLRMPGLSGIDVLHDIANSKPDLKFIVLTAYGTLATAIEALRYRVEDYLLKPSSTEEILASVNRVFSNLPEDRVMKFTNQGQGEVFRLRNGVIVNCRNRTITSAGKTVYLTQTESKFIQILVEHSTQVMPHEDLVQQIQGYHVDKEEAARILRPIVSRLRDKLIDLPGSDQWIRSLRGIGYWLEIS